jgi:electron transfer flavoprotein beta subunit
MAAVTPRYSYARRVVGQVTRVAALETAVVPSVWRTEPAGKRPVKFKAAERKAGHARMLSAIESEAKGGVVIDTGTPAEKAQAILGYLREHKLIDW